MPAVGEAWVGDDELEDDELKDDEEPGGEDVELEGPADGDDGLEDEESGEVEDLLLTPEVGAGGVEPGGCQRRIGIVSPCCRAGLGPSLERMSRRSLARSISKTGESVSLGGSLV